MANKMVNAMQEIKNSEPFLSAVKEATTTVIKEDKKAQKAIKNAVYDQSFCDHLTGKLTRYNERHNEEIKDFMSKVSTGQNIDGHPFLSKMSPFKPNILQAPCKDTKMETDNGSEDEEEQENQSKTEESSEREEKDESQTTQTTKKRGFFSKGVSQARTNGTQNSQSDENEHNSPPNKRTKGLQGGLGFKTGIKEIDSSGNDTE